MERRKLFPALALYILEHMERAPEDGLCWSEFTANAD